MRTETFWVVEKNDPEPQYDAVREYVGGLVERVGLPNGDVLLMNEEGKLEGLPVNADATMVWMTHFGETDVLVGNVILIKKEAVKDW